VCGVDDVRKTGHSRLVYDKVTKTIKKVQADARPDLQMRVEEYHQQLLDELAAADQLRVKLSRWRALNAGLVFGLVVVLAVKWAVASSPPDFSYSRTLPDKGRVWTVILRHLDGDTVQLGSIVDEGTARLLDIDAPETRTKDAAEKAAGKRSAARLEELMPVNSVWRTEISGHDGFDRPLVRFYREDGKTINRQMIEEGFAKEYRP
jgi:hypothetical protein